MLHAPATKPDLTVLLHVYTYRGTSQELAVRALLSPKPRQSAYYLLSHRPTSQWYWLLPAPLPTTRLLLPTQYAFPPLAPKIPKDRYTHADDSWSRMSVAGQSPLRASS